MDLQNPPDCVVMNEEQAVNSGKKTIEVGNVWIFATAIIGS